MRLCRETRFQSFKRGKTSYVLLEKDNQEKRVLFPIIKRLDRNQKLPYLLSCIESILAWQPCIKPVMQKGQNADFQGAARKG